MAIEMSSPWIAGPVGAAAGAALAWIATEYKTRKTYRNVIMLLAKSADDFAGMGQVEKALSIYDQILKDVPRLEPAVRGEVRFRQGLSYYGQSFEGARDTNLRRAVEAFDEAIRLFKPEKHPVEHAQAQNGLGMSLVRLSDADDAWAFNRSDQAEGGRGGEGDERASNLRRAITAFEEALKLYSDQGRDQEHAQTENNLGDAYLLLSKLEGSKAAEDLMKAISAYEEALKFRTAAEQPEDYAETKNSLGRALISLAQLEEGEGKEETVMREALLDEAVSSFKAALEVRTSDAHPEERAETQTLLGQALVLESEPQVSGSEIRWSDREGLKMAIEAYEEALAVRTRESHPQEYAETKNLLGRALVILSGPASGPEDAANLKRAIRAFEEALTIRTLEASHRDYAETQNNLGIAYRNLSKLEDREENLERSILAYEEALRARSGGARKKKNASESPGEEMAGGEKAGEEIGGIGGFGGLGLE
jgi:tetratricopeptide (TPR) repeat protein